MNCKYCAHTVENDSTFCPNCGACNDEKFCSICGIEKRFEFQKSDLDFGNQQRHYSRKNLLYKILSFFETASYPKQCPICHSINTVEYLYGYRNNNDKISRDVITCG